ncbi:MAG: twin-arginine translocase subunit TatB [Actinomycetota bacterium]
MLDIGIGEMVFMALVGLVVFGPERLPRYAAQSAKFLRQFREQVSEARSTLIDVADVDPQTLKDLRDLDPRRALKDSVSDLPQAIADADKAAPKKPAPKSLLDPDTT